jgi:Carboxypeptidase regulatory-like domain
MRISRYLLAVTLAIVLFACGPLFAQTSQVSQISGRVVDQSGAVIPSAQVTITNVNTGIARAVSSGPNGRYAITNLPVGSYRLEVTKSGFQTYVQSGIVLELNTNPTVNVTLRVGAVSQQVTVQASASMVETQDVGVGQVISQARVVDLPLNGRNVTQLVTLSGAAVNYTTLNAGQSIVSNKNYANSTSAFNVAGGQGGQTLFALDGSPNMDLLSNVGLPMPFPDALQEFRVETNSLPANYGGEPGGVVNVVTKSGANQFHGDAFDFLRNYAMNAQNYFTHSRDSLKRNQFGGVIGGPILRNKLFFFGGYQGTRNKSAATSVTDFVATKDTLNGDFSAFLPSSPTAKTSAEGCRAVTLKAPFVNNVDPNWATDKNSVAMNLLALIPTSTDPCGALTFGTPNQDHENQFIGKIDFHQNEKQSWFGRYFFTDFEHAPTYTNNLLTLSSDPNVGLKDRVQNFTLGQTYIINPITVSSFHVSYVRSSTIRYTPPNYPTPALLGAKVYAPVANYMFFSVSGFFGAACANCNPGPWVSNTYQVSENVTWIHGRQQISVGGQWNHIHLTGHGTFQSNGDFFFSPAYTGLALADFELGDVTHYLQSTGQTLHEGLNQPSFYIQDNIHVTPSLSINPGLRWDPFLMPYNLDHEASIFDLGWYNAGVRSQHFVNAPDGTLFYGDPGMPGSSYGNPKIANFSPRIGIVYDPGGKGQESIRAGFGIFDASTPLFEQVGTHAPWADPQNFSEPLSLTGTLSNPWVGSPTGANPFPLQTPIPSDVAFPPFGGGLGNFPLHPQPTYMEQWNLSIQKQLPGDWMVSASYLGNRTLHLELGEDMNPVLPPCSAVKQSGNGPCTSSSGSYNQRRVLYLADPTKAQDYGGITTLGDSANANYNGLLLSAQHRFTHGYTILANYTLSHCLTESTIGLNGAGTPQEFFNRHGDYGNCAWDKRQIFNLSMVANMPSFHTHWMDWVFSHWQLAPIFTASTGDHETVSNGTTDSLLNSTLRPNVVGDPYNVSGNRYKTNTSGQITGYTWFNTSAFNPAPPGNYGDAGAGTITGPGSWDLDMALSRFFPITERQQIEFRAEAFNLMNHTQFGDPDTSLSDQAAGVIRTAAAPRIMQLALKYTF